MSDNRSIFTTLAADEVHAWSVPLGERQEVRDERREAQDQAEALSVLSSRLSTPERERAERFVRDDLRRRFVVAHAALRTILGRYLGVEPEEVPIDYGPHGKPRLAEAGSKEQAARSNSLLPAHCSLHFNLAHSGELAVVAVTHGSEIGIDVEQLRPVRHLEQLAERYFAPSESSAVLAAEPRGRSAEFLAVWTAKEAILKALGTGLSYPLERFAVSPAVDGQWVTLPQPPANGRAKWWLAQLDVATGYVAAVATDSRKKLRPTNRYPDDLA